MRQFLSCVQTNIHNPFEHVLQQVAISFRCFNEASPQIGNRFKLTTKLVSYDVICDNILNIEIPPSLLILYHLLKKQHLIIFHSHIFSLRNVGSCLFFRVNFRVNCLCYNYTGRRQWDRLTLEPESIH